MSRSTAPRLAKSGLTQTVALACLLLMALIALAGPTGIMAWGENYRLLQDHQAELIVLREQRDELKNRVNLLDPRHADPDLAGELVRQNLNVAHPDEVLLLVKP